MKRPSQIQIESSDEEEVAIKRRKARSVRKRGSRNVQNKPSWTSSSSERRSSLPPLIDTSSEDEADQRTKVYGELRGGAGPYEVVLSATDVMRRAIQQAQLQLKLDRDTPGLGNCFSVAMVQQFQRPQVKLFLQSRGMTIASYMQLKQNVEHFVKTHMHTEKMKVLKANFQMSQRNMALENPHLKPRSWSKYWRDMLKDGEWADETFIQACAWFLNMNIIIIYAGHATPEQPFHPMEGTFSTETTGPALLVGYINGNHYQSLLPLQEDRSRPEYLAQTAVDNTLHHVLQRLGLEIAKAKQGAEVSS